jgi:betaine-aldehyde dehydrogenase
MRMLAAMHQYIGGQRRDAASGETFAVLDPSTNQVVETVTLAGPGDVDAAVGAAATAFGEWSRATPVERSTVLLDAARLLDGRAEELARLESRQAGKPIRLAREFDVPGTVDNTAFFGTAARRLDGMASAEYSGDHTSSIRREPIGVVGSIAPWNYPLQMAAWKVLPAIAAGNTIVLKPAEITPLTSILFAEAFTEAGAPAGVVNVVTGTGPVAGQHLVGHPDVSMVSFTGSTGVGRRVMAVAAETGKRVHLELGGKAPFVVFDDADLEAAVHGAVAASLINTGQDCTAATRAIVHRSLHDDFVDGVAELMASVRMGPTGDEDTDLGPLSSQGHQAKVSGMVDRARDYAKVVTGGRLPGGELSRGCYYEPTVVSDVPLDSELWRDEVFGPVLAVVAFDDDDEAIRLANDTAFGLAASAWTRDTYRAGRATREITAGCVWVNDHIPIISEMPHGGYRHSGFGKDMSAYSFDEYTNIKHVMHDTTAVAHKPWHRTIFTLPG